MIYSVRPATIDDLDRLVSFTLAEANEAEGLTNLSQTVRTGIRVGLENPAVARYWVLQTDEGEVIGRISVIKEWSDWYAGYYWWIQSMFIVAEYRGRGLMDRLLTTVKVTAKAEAALELRLYVHQDNRRAIRAYQKAGFAEAVYRIMTLKI